jgi:hypothetical protein
MEYNPWEAYSGLDSVDQKFNFSVHKNSQLHGSYYTVWINWGDKRSFYR